MPMTFATVGLDQIEAASIQVLACLQAALCAKRYRDMIFGTELLTEVVVLLE
jgi:hypothetical protein